MKPTTMLVATLTLLAGGAHAADEYRWELGLGYTVATADTDLEPEATELSGRVRYHLLAPVSLANGPWEESEFLEHSTWLEAHAGRATLEAGAFEADGPTYGAAGRYAAKDVPVAVDGAIAWRSVEDDDSEATLDAFSWQARAGYWIMPNLIAGLGYSSITNEFEAEFDSTSTTDTALFAWGKWVHPLRADLDLNLEAEAGQIWYDDEDGENLTATLEADLYVLKRYGIGLLVGTESGDVAESEGDTLGVQASAWLTEHIGLRAGYSTFAASDEEEGADLDAYFGELVARF